jgi:hypothetical protein
MFLQGVLAYFARQNKFAAMAQYIFATLDERPDRKKNLIMFGGNYLESGRALVPVVSIPLIVGRLRNILFFSFALRSFLA